MKFPKAYRGFRLDEPPSAPTRVGSTRTCCAARLGGRGRRLPRVLADEELHLDAVADDAGQRLRDERAVARLQPVLREAVRHGDPEAGVVHVDQRGVAEPRLEVGRGQGDLELAERRAPDVLRVHEDPVRPGAGAPDGRLRTGTDRADDCDRGERADGPLRTAGAAPRPSPGTSPGVARGRPGTVGRRMVAPPRTGPARRFGLQTPILPGSIRAHVAVPPAGAQPARPLGRGRRVL